MSLLRCSSCGTTNRVPPPQPGRAAICGKCKTPLDPSASANTGPISVTDNTFADEVERSRLPVLLDLWADWCGPCHMLAATVAQVSAELAGKVKVAKLDIDQNPNTANRFGVRSIPTLLILKDGREVDRLVGVQPKQEILRRLAQVLGS
ncbi:MAG: thioredoxin [Vicinamibacterales bacterium]|nr:thioredoxin [Vicinamibacterales bacterium]